MTHTASENNEYCHSFLLFCITDSIVCMFVFMYLEIWSFACWFFMIISCIWNLRCRGYNQSGFLARMILRETPNNWLSCQSLFSGDDDHLQHYLIKLLRGNFFFNWLHHVHYQNEKNANELTRAARPWNPSSKTACSGRLASLFSFWYWIRESQLKNHPVSLQVLLIIMHMHITVLSFPVFIVCI